MRRWRIHGYSINGRWRYEVIQGNYAEKDNLTWIECVEFMREHKLTNSTSRGMIAK